MILEIDVGNTFLKWRLLAADHVVERGRCYSGQLAQGMPEQWPDRVCRVRIGSVAGAEVDALLERYCRQRWQLVPQFARTAAAAGGVRNSYQDPARMGVDRWLAMLAAFNDAGGACCVVDCGSAITVDYVAADGVHQGGYIMPGLRLLKESLLSNTARILVDQSLEQFDTRPGTHTSAAVEHGINLMFQALQEKILADLESRPQPVPLYITGGDGELFHRLAGCGCYRPELVMDGLVWALEG
ncbi:type III pantothenate kinase [Marinobacterium arenosum]|uniref:type III pantothenate kinase n=1 Tax=Marinobacterium arenosum TaxID=2862496 RepID=UPI001C981834|nr:type III pantothenate kinase [Marinobacterium arenosum]MBY4676884.1 type III pantothenate kinase [Marinobacterium arenosum]